MGLAGAELRSSEKKFQPKAHSPIKLLPNSPTTSPSSSVTSIMSQTAHLYDKTLGDSSLKLLMRTTNCAIITSSP